MSLGDGDQVGGIGKDEPHVENLGAGAIGGRRLGGESNA